MPNSNMPNSKSRSHERGSDRNEGAKFVGTGIHEVVADRSSGRSREFYGQGSGQQPILGITGGGHAGKGPKGYKRSDAAIREDICEALKRNSDIDASEIEVNVQEGVVTLTGEVEDRHMKRLSENIALNLPGVNDVQNYLSINKPR